jgi:F0F1-type ATP synthase assembly protein I
MNDSTKEMTPMQSDDKEKYTYAFGRSARALSDYLGIGLQIATSFVFFVLLGYWADSKLGTSPMLLLAGVVVGMVGMGLVLFKTVQKANKKSDQMHQKH